MKRGTKLLLKQGMKYFAIILVTIVSIIVGKLIWALDKKTQYLILLFAGIIFLVGFIFDLLSANDIIPILKR